MKEQNILLVVEPDFHQVHVGVRRVIRYHWRKLSADGHAVTLATPKQGQLAVCSAVESANLMRETTGARYDSLLPTWESGQPPLKQPPADDHFAHGSSGHVQWHVVQDLTPDHFDESILSNPWLCAQRHALPATKYSTGIAYDMVPMLLAMGVLRMPRFLNAYSFAAEHSAGYEFFLHNAKRILCISEATRADFISIYGDRAKDKVEVCIPFDDFGSGTLGDAESNSILLINALDHRKNFHTAAKAIKLAAESQPLSVVIVGRERIPFFQVMEFLTEISQAGADVKWYRSPSDEQLEELIRRARVLFFPSIYEGLGLPILEAQAKGVPAISSNVSSCGEINLNFGLTCDPYDYKQFATGLLGALDGSVPTLSGMALRTKQLEFLHGRNSLKF
jgi:glycosyltransferase involved in cell wall biosynthesis